MTLRRLILALALVAVAMGCASKAEAQECHGRGLLLTCGGPVVAYVPPLDIVPNASAAYGLRLLRRAYTGPAINCRRVSDNAQRDIGFTRRGDLDVATLTAWLGGSACAVAKWYDQSGNGRDASQATAANQPTIAIGSGKPSVIFSGTTQILVAGSSASLGSSFTLAAVAVRTSRFTSVQAAVGFGDGTFPPGLGFAAAANTASFFSPTQYTLNSGASVADSAPHALIGISIGGASQTLTVDGVVSGPNTHVSGESTATVSIGAINGYGSGLSGSIYEAFLWNADQTSKAGALTANMRAYYGF